MLVGMAIDVANHFGDGNGMLPNSLDKLEFEDRIQWG